MKSIFVSKTVWFNALTIIIATATYYGFTPDQSLFEKVTNILIMASPIVNLILRYFTTKAVTLG